MKEDALKQLIENTFSKLANPMQGCCVYAEIEKAMYSAYNMGKDTNTQPASIPEPQLHMTA